MYTAQYKAPAAASKYLCQYKRGGRQNGCSVCVFINRPFLLLLIFCLRQYHSVCIRLRKEKSVCILSSNVMSMAVEDLNLATLFTSFSLSGSEAKFREGQGSRSSSSSGRSCVVILMAVGSARRHTFGFSC